MRWLMLSLVSVLFVACGSEEQSRPATAEMGLVDGQGQALASACSGCHAVGGSAISDLTGWPTENIAMSMTAYKNDAQGTTVMHRLARGYSDDEIQRIAEFLAANLEGAAQ